MRSIPRVGIYLDTRHKNAAGLYPVKLRVSFIRKVKYYKTDLNLSKEGFEKAMKLKSPQGKIYQIKEELQNLIEKGRAIIKDLDHFSFKSFEQKYYDLPMYSYDVFEYYDKLIEEYRMNQSISTMELYSLSKSAVKKYIVKNKRDKALLFDSVTENRLKEMETLMLKDGKSMTTISMYMRCLRHVFNSAISDGIIKRDVFPFFSHNSKGYRIIKTQGKKKALSLEQLKSLIEFTAVKDSPQSKARDLWLISFYCNGMNFHDLLHLKNHNYDGQKITFIRSKTKDRSNKQIKIEVQVVEKAKLLINVYRSRNKHRDDFLFPYLHDRMDPGEVKRTVKNLTRFVNQHIKSIAKQINLPPDLSTYWARYSFSTLAKNRGASTEFIKESLGHTDIRTTEIYLDSFDDDVRKKTTEKIFEDI